MLDSVHFNIYFLEAVRKKFRKTGQSSHDSAVTPRDKTRWVGTATEVEAEEVEAEDVAATSLRGTKVQVRRQQR